VAAPWIGARAATAAEEIAAQHHSQRDTAAMIALEHAPELRVGGRLPTIITEAERQQRDWGLAIDRAAAPAAFASAVPTAAIGASVFGAVVAGVTLASTVAPTTVAILMLLPLSAFEATTALPAAAMQLARSRIAARRLLSLTDADGDDARRPPVPAVRLEPGARLAVTGPSGAGKTTLLMTMAENPSKAVFFAEDAHLFATTVRDNLLVVRGDATDDELRNALRRVGLGGWLDALPHGLSTVLVGGAAAVSAGQRRRLLLARALISTAPTVLLDEHLDAHDGQQIITELLTPDGLFPAERTVVVATHHLPDHIRCPRLNLAIGE
jgi:ATP-binding cassette subfamily C protein CydC